jgi:hypothetical protein
MIVPEVLVVGGRHYEATFDVDFEGDLTVEIRCNLVGSGYGHCCPGSIMLGSADRDALAALLEQAGAIVERKVPVVDLEREILRLLGGAHERSWKQYDLAAYASIFEHGYRQALTDIADHLGIR